MQDWHHAVVCRGYVDHIQKVLPEGLKSDCGLGINIHYLSS